MALTAATIQPWVHEMGGATISENQWKASIHATGGVWSAGEFLVKTIDGTVEAQAAGDAAIVHAVALEDHAVADGAVFTPILEIASDTVFAGQLNDSAATPAQANIGEIRELAVASNIWTVGVVDGTAASNSVEVTGIWLNDHSYLSNHDFAGTDGIVYFKIRQFILDSAPAAVPT